MIQFRFHFFPLPKRRLFVVLASAHWSHWFRLLNRLAIHEAGDTLWYIEKNDEMCIYKVIVYLNVMSHEKLSFQKSQLSAEHLEEPDIWYRFLPLGQIPRTGEGVNHLELLSLVGVLKVSTGSPQGHLKVTSRSPVDPTFSEQRSWGALVT